MEMIRNCPICNGDKHKTVVSSKDFFLTQETFQIVECSKCGFRFTNPRPEPASLGKYYESTEYISHSDKRKGLFASVYQLIRTYTLGRKQVLVEKYSPKGRILDIGCATGHFLHHMKGNGWDTMGIEPDKKTRERAIKELGVEVYAEEKLDTIINSEFDVVSLWHVLEHVPGLSTRMQQINKVLKKRGILILALPNPNSYDAIHYGEYWAGYDLPRHLYHFTKRDVETLLKKYGFALKAIRPMRFDSFYVSLLSEKYKTGKMKWLSAFGVGFISNLKARKDMNYSSLIYIAEKI